MNRTSYASIARELASHGCAVFCIEHTDISATYSPSAGQYKHWEEIGNDETLVRADQIKTRV